MKVPRHIDGDTARETEDRIRAAVNPASTIDAEQHVRLVLTTVLCARQSAFERLLEQSAYRAALARRFLDARYDYHRQGER